MTTPRDAMTEIRRLYYGATKATVVDDLERAIDLLKAVPTEKEREKAAVYMDGLSQMRSEWGVKTPTMVARKTRVRGAAAARRRPSRPKI